MWTYVLYGTLLGLSAGVSPGPLLALVISQTLKHNSREGIKIAAAPLLTDLPIILFGLLAVSNIPNPDLVLGIVSFLGCIFIIILGISSILYRPVDIVLPEQSPRSYIKGAFANALSPHPYIFWFSVGIPTLIKASQYDVLGGVGFVSSFYVFLVGSKVVLALLVGRSRVFMTGAIYLWAMRLLGCLLICFGVLLFYDGAKLVGM